MEALLKARRYLSRCFLKNIQKLNDLEEEVELEVILDQLNSIFQEYKKNHEQVIILASDDAFDSYQEPFEEISGKYYAAVVDIKKKLADFSSPKVTQGARTSNSVDVKLPPLELPVFRGVSTEWPSFVDLFTSAVDSQGQLSPAQKLQYLKTSMRGDASNILKHLPTTDAAYKEAWSLLKNRFQNTREIVNAHLKKLFRFEKIEGTPSSLRSLLDCSNECRRALSLLNISFEDAIYNFLLWEKLDAESRKCWELSLHDDSIPSHDKMIQFFEQRARALGDEVVSRKTNSFVKNSVTLKCPACSANHLPFLCERFKRSSPKDRENMIRTAKLCFNCLQPNHSMQQCSSRGCKKCGKQHHTLLHKEIPSPTNHCLDKPNSIVTLLATAEIHVKDENGGKHSARALLDLGSAVSFVTNDFARNLNLKTHETNMSWKGVGESGSGFSNRYVNMTAVSRVNPEHSFRFVAYTTKHITGNLPPTNVNLGKNLKFLKSLHLADENFGKSRPVDILLGADVLPGLMKEGIVKLGTTLPVAQNTELGWILYGPALQGVNKVANSLCAYPTLNDQVQQFWKTEEVSSNKVLTSEEELCEEFFKNTVKREKSGRYVVRMPYKSNITELPDNKTVAFKRFLALERKFEKNPQFKNEYVSAIRDFQEKGHLIPVKSKGSEFTSYLPHHAVIKENHSTTKLRVVFDASAKTSDGHSLNDVLLNGPKLQDDLLDILIRFRMHQVVFTADIEKMYRQINLHQSDFDAHRILWRTDRSSPIEEFCLTTVTFGIKPAPYLATRTLLQLAEDEGSKYPMASPILKRDFYVDDLLSGCQTTEEAKATCLQLDKLLHAGGFTLRKWTSNDPKTLEHIPEERRAPHATLSIDEGEFIKTLGLQWNPTRDTFSFKITSLSEKRPSKRTVLSNICRTFDPLGWLSPVTIKGKIIFQDLWKEVCGWDDSIPDHLLRKWNFYKEDLKYISEINIPRKTMPPHARDLVLCGFADASEKAYAAAVYLRSVDINNTVHVNLIAAKTRVAPIKPLTVPRLELNAALLLARLLKRTSDNIGVKEIHAWTDSSVTLAWIKGDAARWKSYVSHRVTDIQENLEGSKWHHVVSEENPADCASRGIGSLELKLHTLWWKGPTFLYSDDFVNSLDPKPASAEVEKEAKLGVLSIHHVNIVKRDLLERYSCYKKLLRITAYVLRFQLKCRKLSSEFNHITVKELQAAETLWVKLIQEEHFREEIHALSRNKEVLKSSNIIGLSPFLDDKGVLRVGGRLANSSLSYDQKHPILLPKNSRFSELLVEHLHKMNCHAGTSLLLSTIRRTYWIVNAKSLIQKIIIRCLRCHRLKAKGATQFMGNLPFDRVSPNPAFNVCGVDYAGPITLKGMTGRKNTHKGYIAVFVCFSTKAIHLELVSSLTSQAFIAALRRFVARRGLCRTIYSDNGTNFFGANRELRQMLKLATNEDRNTDIAQTLQELSIEWHFNPPGAPHFGGLWEAGVKSVKHHLYRIIGNVTLTFEEMTTTLSQIEACLNSRPLCELSSDPSDLEALTPGHFLIGRPLNAIPEPDYTKRAENRLVRFQLCQKMVQHFWKRWSSEYLSRLQKRPKWLSLKKNLIVGQLVLLIEDNISPLMWKLGRIKEIHPGSDGLVRVVTVITQAGERKRPITKIAPLPLATEETDLI